MSNGSAPNKRMARAAMILGAGSLPFLGCAGVTGIVAIVLGIIAYRRACRQPRVYGGKGMAVTGIVCGALGIPIMGVYGVFMDRRRHSLNERAAIAEVSGEKAAIADVRRVMAAEAAYRSFNSGYYDTLECLGAPDTCIPFHRGPAFLQGPLAASDGRRSRYKYTLHLGPPPVRLYVGVSRSSVQSYAFVAEAIHDGPTPGRTFCGDDSGDVCAWPADATRIVGAHCPSECTPIPRVAPVEAR